MFVGVSKVAIIGGYYILCMDLYGTLTSHFNIMRHLANDKLWNVEPRPLPHYSMQSLLTPQKCVMRALLET